MHKKLIVYMNSKMFKNTNIFFSLLLYVGVRFLPSTLSGNIFVKFIQTNITGRQMVEILARKRRLCADPIIRVLRTKQQL